MNRFRVILGTMSATAFSLAAVIPSGVTIDLPRVGHVNASALAAGLGLFLAGVVTRTPGHVPAPPKVDQPMGEG